MLKRKSRNFIFILSILLTITALPNLSKVSALTYKSEKEMIVEFRRVVELTDEYKKLKSKILEAAVEKYTSTEIGDRITISYNTSDNEQLIFVGDNNYSILYIGFIYEENNLLKINDVLDKTTVSLSLTSSSESWIDPNCSTYSCAKSETYYYIDPQPGCSLVVSEACRSLLLIPGYTGIISYAICKAGVFIYCSVYKNKRCLEGTWLNVCPV